MDRLYKFIFLVHFASLVKNSAAVETIIAINAGGPAHTDIHGITYRQDPLNQGFASDYGKRYLIGRVSEEDLVLYQTERYALENFKYDLTRETGPFVDGDYVLVLKFSEVYFDAPNQKVFSVALNDHIVVQNLDIFARVGRAVAHDEIIPFTIKDKKLHTGAEISNFDGTLKLTFLKTEYDNPKVNAFYVIKGTPSDVPAMPPAESHEEFIQQREEVTEEESENTPKYASGPKVSDPYAQQEISQMFIPVLIALACFFPVLFCLCRL